VPKSSSEIIAEGVAERWRKRVVEQDAEILRLKDQIIESAKTCEHLLQRLQRQASNFTKIRRWQVSDKVTWSVQSIDETKAHVVCTCGDVSVYMYQTDDGDFYMWKCVNGVWMQVDNPLWADLPSAMAEAARICRGEDA